MLIMGPPIIVFVNLILPENLPRTSDESRFHLAVSLGNRHGLPVGDIACAHLHSLLLNSEGLPISELTLRVTRTQLVQMLASDQDHVSTR